MKIQKKILNLPLSIWILGLTGFLINLSTIMVFSQMPMFMKLELGASEHQVGIIDGFVEFISHFIRIIAGSVSDIFQNRKFMLGLGYGLSTIVKPLFAFSSSIGVVIIIRSLDRITNGLQASPRDALIGELAPQNKRGSSYGLSKSLKTAGSVVGAGLVIWIMHVTNNNFRTLFMWAFVPAATALILFLWGVKEPKNSNKFFDKDVQKSKRINWKAFLELKGGFWKVILLLSIYELAHFGESYLTFRAAEVGINVKYISFVMLVFNLGQFLIAYPLGTLSDRFQRRNILFLGFCFMIMANICMMLGNMPWIICLGVFFWGAQMGTTQSIFVSMISDETPHYLRGTAFGIFYMVMGIDILVASKIAGVIWESHGSSSAFLYSACIALFSIFCLFFLFPGKKNKLIHKNS